MNRNTFLRTLGFGLAGAVSMASRLAEIHSEGIILKPARLQEGDTIGLIAPAGIPAFYGSIIRHEPDIFTLPIGIRAEMDAEKGSIQLKERPVL